MLVNLISRIIIKRTLGKNKGNLNKVWALVNHGQMLHLQEAQNTTALGPLHLLSL